MVPTTSLDNDLNFKGCDLARSEFEQDQALCDMAEKRLTELVNKLVPIIRYIDDEEHHIRSIEVCKDGDFVLLLSRDGKWYGASSNSGAEEKNENAWQWFTFGNIVNGLEEAFARGTEKRARHMAAIEKRSALLERVGAVIRGEAVPAVTK